MEAISSLISALNTMSPLAVIALLGFVLWQMARNQKVVTGSQKTITDNHLHGLPEMERQLGEIAATLQRIEVTFTGEFAHIRARLNGRDSK